MSEPHVELRLTLPLSQVLSQSASSLLRDLYLAPDGRALQDSEHIGDMYTAPILGEWRLLP